MVSRKAPPGAGVGVGVCACAVPPASAMATSADSILLGMRRMDISFSIFNPNLSFRPRRSREPESITTGCGSGFAAFVAPRNDGVLHVASRPFGHLAELLEHAIALELRQMIDEQDAVGVVDLMLQAGGKQPVGGNL